MLSQEARSFRSVALEECETLLRASRPVLDGKPKEELSDDEKEREKQRLRLEWTRVAEGVLVAPPHSQASSRECPLSLEYEPLNDPLNRDLARCFSKYRYIVQPPTIDADRASTVLQELLITNEEQSYQTEKIAGGVTMYDLASIAAYKDDPELSGLLEKIGYEAAAAAGLDIERTHVMVAPKLLKVEPGYGQQLVHWDTMDAWNNTGSYAMILNCSERTVSSTAFPRFSVPLEFQFDEPDPTAQEHVGLTPARLEQLRHRQKQARLRQLAYLLDPEWFHSVEFKRGEVGFFEQSNPHFGTRNESSRPRVVFFCMFVRSSVQASVTSMSADADQFFRWMYMWEAFRTPVNRWPREWAEALLEDVDEGPIARFRSTRDAKEAKVCLSKHGLLPQYLAVVKAKDQAEANRLKEAEMMRLARAHVLKQARGQEKLTRGELKREVIKDGIRRSLPPVDVDPPAPQTRNRRPPQRVVPSPRRQPPPRSRGAR
jgi:hypothetical protein